jgi:hypothetical protein
VDSARYVYAIVRRGTPLPAGLTGLDDQPLAVIGWRELVTVTSPIGRAALRVSRPDLNDIMRHERVVEAVRGQGPGLPVRFGTVLSSADAVTEALEERYAALIDDLKRLGDKVELGVSLLWTPPNQPLPDPLTTGEDQPSTGPGATYLRALSQQHQHQAALRNAAQALATELDEVVRAHVIEVRHALLPTDRLALRSSMLLHPSGCAAVGELVEAAFGDRPELRLLLSGPWPPYSFVTATSRDRRSLLGRLIELVEAPR